MVFAVILCNIILTNLIPRVCINQLRYNIIPIMNTVHQHDRFQRRLFYVYRRKFIFDSLLDPNDYTRNIDNKTILQISNMKPTCYRTEMQNKNLNTHVNTCNCLYRDNRFENEILSLFFLRT